MRNQAVATAFSLLLRFVWECVKMASNRIYVNAKISYNKEIKLLMEKQKIKIVRKMMSILRNTRLVTFFRWTVPGMGE